MIRGTPAALELGTRKNKSELRTSTTPRPSGLPIPKKTGGPGLTRAIPAASDYNTRRNKSELRTLATARPNGFQIPKRTGNPGRIRAIPRGSGASREKEQSRTSNFSNFETRWVADPEVETWASWSDTGKTRYLPEIYEWEKEQKRTSNLGNTQTRWIYSHTGP